MKMEETKSTETEHKPDLRAFVDHPLTPDESNMWKNVVLTCIECLNLKDTAPDCVAKKVCDVADRITIWHRSVSGFGK